MPRASLDVAVCLKLKVRIVAYAGDFVAEVVVHEVHVSAFAVGVSDDGLDGFPEGARGLD